MIAQLEKKGMKGLVLDLSDNPGGLLSTAVDVAECFLPAGKLVVYTETSRNGEIIREDYRTGRGGLRRTYPVTVLVNQGSASASEIVAGALQEYKRAPLIGEKTYGKGSVQRIIQLGTTYRRTCMKITAMKWYTPFGHSINRQGIEPDIKVDFPSLTRMSIEARLKLRDTLALLDYIRSHFDQHEETFRRLLDFDEENAGAYPEFDALMKDIAAKNVEIDRQDVRREIRRSLISFLETEKGENIVIDIQESPALQHAVLELRRMLNVENGDLPLYQWYEKQIAKRAEKAALIAERKKGSWPPPPEKESKKVQPSPGQ
ncbi:MAG: S41 family peptidase [Planctomycetota bacterium]|jgi:hypothetical protein